MDPTVLFFLGGSVSDKIRKAMDVTPLALIGVSRCFRGMYYLHSLSLFCDPENGDRNFL
jgi:hypothetical protein